MSEAILQRRSAKAWLSKAINTTLEECAEETIDIAFLEYILKDLDSRTQKFDFAQTAVEVEIVSDEDFYVELEKTGPFREFAHEVLVKARRLMENDGTSTKDIRMLQRRWSDFTRASCECGSGETTKSSVMTGPGGTSPFSLSGSGKTTKSTDTSGAGGTHPLSRSGVDVTIKSSMKYGSGGTSHLNSENGSGVATEFSNVTHVTHKGSVRISLSKSVFPVIVIFVNVVLINYCRLIFCFFRLFCSDSEYGKLYFLSDGTWEFSPHMPWWGGLSPQMF